MKGLYSVEQDTVISYGLAYDNMGAIDSVYDIPDDFEFGKYQYTSITIGVFNPDGFIKVETSE